MMTYDEAFSCLVREFRIGEWEVRQEDPPQAYLHISRPCWGDELMNGIHLETYVLDGQIAMGCAPVALHCEGGYPNQQRFAKVFRNRIKDEMASWENAGEWKLQASGCSLLEIYVALGETSEVTIERLSCELRRLQTLAPIIDKTIADLESNPDLGL